MIVLSDEAAQPSAEHVKAVARARKLLGAREIAKVEPPDISRTEART